MAEVQLCPSNRAASTHEVAGRESAELKHECECADFELDDVLRGLALDRWFATAQRDVPIWAF